MFRIKTIAPEEATGMVAEIYGQFPAEIGVPHAIQMMSASPGFLGRKINDLKSWHDHATISQPMQKAMRMLISGKAGMDSCRDANGAMLQKGGLDAAQVAAFQGPVAAWPFADKENAMVNFVVEHVTEHRPADEADIARLQELGWSDAEIFEGLAFGGMVFGVVATVAVLKK